jgi:hypothetical protein
MTLPASGQLTFHAIYTEINGSHSSQQVSLRAMASAASMTVPDSVAEFYGYSSIPTLSVDYDHFSFDWYTNACDATVCHITANSTNHWTASTEDMWVIINGVAGGTATGTGNGSFTIGVSMAKINRFGEIGITSSAPSVYVAVTQNQNCA